MRKNWVKKSPVCRLDRQVTVRFGKPGAVNAPQAQTRQAQKVEETMNSTAIMKADQEPKTGQPAEPTVEKIIFAHPFLQGMTPGHLRLLTDCAILETFACGEHVFQVGDPANRFYLIQEGRVALGSFVEGIGNSTIQTIGSGDVLGWSWLFPPYFWHFNARAIETTRVVFIYATPLREVCETDHDFGYEMMKRMAGVMVQRLQATRWKLLGSAPKLNPRG